MAMNVIEGVPVIEDDSSSDDSDAADDPSQRTRLYDAVCEVFGISDAARDVCRDGVVLMNRLYSRGYREPALLVRDWLQGMNNMYLVSAIVIAKAMGLHFAFNLLLDVSASWVEEGKDTALHLAVRKNNIELTDLLVEIEEAKMEKLKKKKNREVISWLNWLDSKNMTPLGIAASNGYVGCLQLLLEGGADINVTCKHEVELLYDVESDHSDYFSLLLELEGHVTVGHEDGYSPLEMAVANGHPECIALLLSAGANIESLKGRGALHRAALTNNTEMLKMLLDSGFSKEEEYYCVMPLHVAAAFGALECLQLLIESGANVDTDAWSTAKPLHLSVELYLVYHMKAQHSRELYDTVQSKQIDCVKSLLKAEADVNALDKNMDTPAHRAARYGCAGALSLLFDAGCDANSLNARGETILHAAVHSCVICKTSYQLDTMRVAINAGVNLEVKDQRGRTALHLALEQARPEQVQLLVDAGADVRVLSPDGDMPSMWLYRKANPVQHRYRENYAEDIKRCLSVLVQAEASAFNLSGR